MVLFRPVGAGPAVECWLGYPGLMPDASSVVEYASPPPARKKFPAILWWFLADVAFFGGALGYMMVAYEDLPSSKELPPHQQGILEIWMFAAFALFMFLLGWAACGWWRSRRSG